MRCEKKDRNCYSDEAQADEDILDSMINGRWPLHPATSAPAHRVERMVSYLRFGQAACKRLRHEAYVRAASATETRALHVLRRTLWTKHLAPPLYCFK